MKIEIKNHVDTVFLFPQSQTHSQYRSPFIEKLNESTVSFPNLSPLLINSDRLMVISSRLKQFHF